MVHIILEHIVNCTPPAAISLNIESQAGPAITGEKDIVQELPIINFIRSCWTIIRIIGETLAAYRIGKLEQWDKLFSDSTRQTALLNLVIGVIYEIRLRPPILSTSIILVGETSEHQVNAVLSTITGCWKQLQ